MAAMHKRAKIAPVILVTALTAVLLGAAWKAGSAARRLAFHEQLRHATDSEIATQLRRAIRISPTGAEDCLIALESPRGGAVAAAREVLFEELARWQLLPDAQAQQRRQQLAQRSESLSGQGHQAAQELAALLLMTAQGMPAADRAAFTLACGQVTRAAVDTPAAPPPEDHIVQRSATRVRTASWFVEPAGEAIQVHAVSQPVADELPGRGAESSMRHLGESNELSEFPSVADRPMQETSAPQRLPGDMSHARPIGEPVNSSTPGEVLHEKRPADVAAPSIAEPQRLALPTTVPAPIVRPSIETRLETMRLVERLHAEDTSLAERARQELVRRGLTRPELEIAERLSDPDASTRLRWLHALPGLPQIDARPWLLWLSRDADAEVRLAAVSIMATSGEAEMMRRVAEMAREEIDPRVKAQAGAIAAQWERSRDR